MRSPMLCVATIGLLAACSETSLGISNNLPTVAITSHLQGDQVVEGIPFVVRATAGDSDNQLEDLVATWFVANELWGECNKLPLNADGATECEVSIFVESDPPRISVEVRDPANGVATDAVTLDVLPQREGYGSPSVEIVAPDDGTTASQGEPTVWEGQVSDPQDDATDIGLEWSSSIDGVFSTAGPDTSGTALFVYGELSPGPHVVTLKATDTDGNFTTDVITHTINGVPIAPVVSIMPDPPSSAEDLQATIDVDSVDPDDDPVSYTFEWMKNGVPQVDQTGAQVLAAATARGDIWTVRVTPNDGVASGPFGEAEVTVVNTAPAVQSVTLTPDPAYTDDIVTATFSVFDADDDPLIYSWDWQVNGVSQYVSGDSLDGLAHFDKHDLVQVFVTAHDGSDDSAPLGSNVLTIANSAPTEPVVSIAPVGPIEQIDDLICSVDAPSTDLDGDPITYEFSWEVDGIEYPDIGDVGPYSTLWPDDSASAADTHDGERWVVTVIALDDDLTASLPAQDGVVIGSATFVPDYNGLFRIQPRIDYSCEDTWLGLTVVDFSITQLVFSESGNTLTITGAPTTMRQTPAPADENFSAQGVISGGCDETYMVSGAFVDNDQWAGMIQVSFTGPDCSLTDCTNQVWPVNAMRQ